MNMFLHELKAYRKSTIMWAILLAALAALYIMIFRAMGDDIDTFRKMLENVPEAARKAFSISLEFISTLVGFYSIVFTYIMLFGAIQAMNLGTSIVSKEVRDKTADFLLTKPVSRKQIMTFKLLAAFTSLVITNIIYLSITSLLALTVNEKTFSLKTFVMVSVTLFFVQLIFMALGVIVSVIVPKIKSVISVSLSTVFAFFILSAFGSILGEKAIKYLTPFKYFDPTYIIKNSAYETSYLVVGFVFVIAAIAASYVVYVKKDIHAV